ncbi:phage tail tape measure protein [Clostridium sp. CX1]|uniref:phage tail tape measure protein n=1 Tax=Clostridium sp. CX1 TaxID=2978346 RepID=UPI0021BFD077|nr:phage tail tape measure protein [Clostridium sp. CX1]MCT8975492.1 phage tail tape measure protein [Clostridium sp. CX1]
MARKTFEMSFQIGGKLASSFSSTFSTANSRLTSLKNEARQTQRALDALNNDFRKGKITQDQLSESTQRLTKELSRLESTQKRIKGFKSALSNGLDTAKNVASTAAFATAVTATGVAMSSLDKAASFQQQITKVGVIASASGEEMKKLSNTALELGASSSLSATEVATAMQELASKGMDTNKIIGAMPGILAAAEASGEDLSMTSSVVTSALNAFELKATEASHVADVMAMSANKTAAGVEDLGYSFKYAAPVANTLGLSLEELASATGVMVDKGLSGEQAGTSLRMALIRLSNPPKEARKALDKLNLSVTDSQGKFKNLAELSDNWNKATKNLSDTQKVQYASTVFGTEAATGMLNLFSAGPEKINELTKSLKNSTGAAEKAAKAMKDNYAGSLEELKGSVETAQIKFATPILPVFQDLFNGISSGIDKSSGGIEQAGERLASTLKDVFKPFTSEDAKFSNMDFGDKVVYMLDEASAKTEEWLSGPGGESMNKIFAKLGEIAAKAWYNAFTGALKTSMSNLAEGNVFSALGSGAVAWMLGGGVLAKGALGAGKGIYNKAKGAKATASGVTPKSVPAPVPSTSSKGKIIPFPTKQVAQSVTNTSVLKPVLGKVGNVLGKAALPATIAMEAYNVYRSNDKAKSTVQAGTGLAGSLGGAKIGAAIGTAIAPGIGTAIGGFIGGLGGYVAGKWVGGKAVDTTRQSTATQTNTQTSATASPTNAIVAQSTAELKSAVTTTVTSVKSLETYAVQANTQLSINLTSINAALTLNTTNLQTLALSSGQAATSLTIGFMAMQTATSLSAQNFQNMANSTGQINIWMSGSFMGIRFSADALKSNLGTLASTANQAGGWLQSLSGISTAGKRVETALNNLATRINNMQVPSSVGSSDKRVSYNG